MPLKLGVLHHLKGCPTGGQHLKSHTAERQPRLHQQVHSKSKLSDRRAPGRTRSAICVQRLDDSLNSAIHTTYRSLLRSSSMHEPRGPPLEVMHVSILNNYQKQQSHEKYYGAWEDKGPSSIATHSRES